MLCGPRHLLLADPGRWDRYHYGPRVRDPRTYDRRYWYEAEYEAYRRENHAYGDRLVTCLLAVGCPEGGQSCACLCSAFQLQPGLVLAPGAAGGPRRLSLGAVGGPAAGDHLAPLPPRGGGSLQRLPLCLKAGSELGPGPRSARWRPGPDSGQRVRGGSRGPGVSPRLGSAPARCSPGPRSTTTTGGTTPALPAASTTSPSRPGTRTGRRRTGAARTASPRRPACAAAAAASAPTPTRARSTGPTTQPLGPTRRRLRPAPSTATTPTAPTAARASPSSATPPTPPGPRWKQVCAEAGAPGAEPRRGACRACGRRGWVLAAWPRPPPEQGRGVPAPGPSVSFGLQLGPRA